jgi:hypothetical protein
LIPYPEIEAFWLPEFCKQLSPSFFELHFIKRLYVIPNEPRKFFPSFLRIVARVQQSLLEVLCDMPFTELQDLPVPIPLISPPLGYCHCGSKPFALIPKYDSRRWAIIPDQFCQLCVDRFEGFG